MLCGLYGSCCFWCLRLALLLVLLLVLVTVLLLLVVMLLLLLEVVLLLTQTWGMQGSHPQQSCR